jgi:CBS domain-containing protein
MHPIVRTFMDTDTHALRETDDVYEALETMIDEGVTGAPVVDEQGQLVGMLSEFECLRLLTVGTADEAEVPAGGVSEFMARKYRTVSPDMDVYYVAGLFLADPAVRRFAVVEGTRLVGVITRKDILRAVQPRVPR